MSEALGRSNVPAWEDCRVPGNAYDANQPFRCAALGRRVEPGECVRFFRTGERMRTRCTGCPAGRSRARFVSIAEPRPVLMLAPATSEPADDGRLAALEAENVVLRAQLAKANRELADFRKRRRSVERATACVQAQRRGQGSKFQFTISFRHHACFDPMRVWCASHGVSVTQLVRLSLMAHAATQGVTLEPVAVVYKGGALAEHRSQKLSAIIVPVSWKPWIDQLRQRRVLARTASAAITAYMEAHP